MLRLVHRHRLSVQATASPRLYQAILLRHKSTVPKEAAGPFTTNDKISTTSRPEDKTLVYLGNCGVQARDRFSINDANNTL